MNKSILVALPFALLGCAGIPTASGFKQTMDGYVGQPLSRLVTAMGPPRSEYALQDGSKVLQYTTARAMLIPQFQTTQAVRSTTSGTVHSLGGGMSNYSAETTTYQPVQAPPTSISLSCTVNFSVTAGGIVSAWSAQGNDCKAPTPK